MRGSVPAVNGRPRRCLTEEIDRLEHILDGLAGALDGAGAVKDVVGAAATEALSGFAAGNPRPAVPTALDRVRRWLSAATRSAAVWSAAVLGAAAAAVSRDPRAGVVAGGVGLTVAAVCWAGPAGLAAVAAGAAAALLAAVAAGHRLNLPAHATEQPGRGQAEGGGCRSVFDRDRYRAPAQRPAGLCDGYRPSDRDRLMRRGGPARHVRGRRQGSHIAPKVLFPTRNRTV